MVRSIFKYYYVYKYYYYYYYPRNDYCRAQGLKDYVRFFGFRARVKLVSSGALDGTQLPDDFKNCTLTVTFPIALNFLVRLALLCIARRRRGPLKTTVSNGYRNLVRR
jgi:hypothetical protein